MWVILFKERGGGYELLVLKRGRFFLTLGREDKGWILSYDGVMVLFEFRVLGDFRGVCCVVVYGVVIICYIWGGFVKIFKFSLSWMN